MPDYRPIETVWDGFRFRSRLEARWAVFFKSLGIHYDYEPEGYDLGRKIRYLPDFYIPSWGCFVEVKGPMPEEAEYQKSALLCEATKIPVMVLVGRPWPAEHTCMWAFGEYDPNEYSSQFVECGCGKQAVLDTELGLDFMLLGDDHTCCRNGNCKFARAGDAFGHNIQIAYLAARQARFEFGEQPRIG